MNKMARLSLMVLVIAVCFGLWFMFRPQPTIAAAKYNCVCFDDQKAAILFRDTVAAGDQSLALELMRNEKNKLHPVPKDAMFKVHEQKMGMLKLTSVRTGKPCWLPKEYTNITD
jgi:hypothetical protein